MKSTLTIREYGSNDFHGRLHTEFYHYFRIFNKVEIVVLVLLSTLKESIALSMIDDDSWESLSRGSFIWRDWWLPTTTRKFIKSPSNGYSRIVIT